MLNLRFFILILPVFACAFLQDVRGESEELPVGLPQIIDVGTRSANRHLGYGWSSREGTATNNSCWIRAYEGDVDFVLGAVTGLEVVVRAAPLFVTSRRQVIGVFANQHYLGTWTCETNHLFAEHRMAIDAGHLQAGTNRLTFRMGYKIRIPPDTRELSLNVDRIEIREAP